MSGLFGSKSQPATPAVPEPTIMPVPDDAAMKAKKKKSLAEQYKSGGRESTILSTSDKLGSS